MKNYLILVTIILTVFIILCAGCDQTAGKGLKSFIVAFDKNNYDSDGTDAEPRIKIVRPPETTIDKLPEPPTRGLFYDFSGWNSEAEGSGYTFTASTQVSADMTVYAQWQYPAYIYTVTFNKNNIDPNSTDADPLVKYVKSPATTIDSLPKLPTLPGFGFTSWNTRDDGSGIPFTSATPVAADITVFAQWQYIPPGSYVVWFDKNNIDADSTEANPLIKIARPESPSIGSLPEPPMRTGYTFNGWNTQANGSGTLFTAALVITVDITVYAQWTADTYTVAFNKNNNDADNTEANPQTMTVIYPATIGSLPSPPTRPHYNFTGWNTQADGSGTTFTAAIPVIADMTVYAQWAADTYTVTFNKNNSDTSSTEANPQTKTVIYPATTVENLPIAPVRNGYALNSWNTQANGSGTPFSATTPVSTNITVYAQWTVDTYTVTFNKNNSDTSSTEANPQTKVVIYPATNVGSLPTAPMRTNYGFAGWNTQADGSGMSFTATTPITADITVYAQWKLKELLSANGIEMVWIPPGVFQMGSPTTEPDRNDDETQHQVILTSGFYMGKYQLTQEQYHVVTGSNPSYFSGSDRPVEQLSWYDALVFCNKLSIAENMSPAYSISGSTDPEAWGNVPTSSNTTWNAVVIVSGSNGYRLPTEAQWEYACRGGTTMAFNTGQTISIFTNTGWYNANSNGTTHPVGTMMMQHNIWRLYDMHGNVYEWCWDWYGTYASGTQTDPTGAASGSSRLTRGGSWYAEGAALRSAYRRPALPTDLSYEIGFRLVRP